MQIEDQRELHRKLVTEMWSTLVTCGVPKSALAMDVKLQEYRHTRKYDAELLLLGEDRRTIVAQFETALGTCAYDMALQALGNLPRYHKCYVVTLDRGNVVLSFADKSQPPQWMKLSDTHAMEALFGNYTFNSAQAIECSDNLKQGIISQQLKSYLMWVGLIGLVIALVAGGLEVCGIEFSWKIYCSLFAIFIAFTVASGYSIRIKI